MTDIAQAAAYTDRLLAERPSRDPAHQQENAALRSLAVEMEKNPTGCSPR